MQRQAQSLDPGGVVLGSARGERRAIHAPLWRLYLPAWQRHGGFKEDPSTPLLAPRGGGGNEGAVPQMFRCEQVATLALTCCLASSVPVADTFLYCS